MKYAILALLCLLTLPQLAYADCVSDCQASTYCDGSSYDCARIINDCYLRECNANNNIYSRPSIAGAYGAIAYDEDSGAYGLADSSPDKSSAKKSAMKYCSRHGSNCEI